MAHIEVKAQQLRMEAEKKLHSTGFLVSLFTKRSDRLEESIDYFTRAGNLFKTAKNWPEAAQAFADAGDLCVDNKNYCEAALNYAETANCLTNCDLEKAVEFYLKCVGLYQEIGKYSLAAKYHQVIAELLEVNGEIEEAVENYEKASVLYKQECNYSGAHKCLEKIAEYASLSGDYDKAINIFQDMACFDLSSSLLRYHARQFLFRAAVCLLCTNVDVRLQLQRYANLYPAFEDSREYQLIISLLECMEDGDVEGYTSVLRKYDAVADLSQWHITMLLRVKNMMTDPNLS